MHQERGLQRKGGGGLPENVGPLFQPVSDTSPSPHLFCWSSVHSPALGFLILSYVTSYFSRKQSCKALFFFWCSLSCLFMCALHVVALIITAVTLSLTDVIV